MAAISPTIACRINNSALRQLRERKTGVPKHDTAQYVGTHDAWRGGRFTLANDRVMLGDDRLPAVFSFEIVDDYLIRGPTKAKDDETLSTFMSHMLWLGFICQRVKTSPPTQVQKFCGLLFDIRSNPTIRIPTSKLSRSLAATAYIRLLHDQQALSRLSALVWGGLPRSLVEDTQARQGQT